MWTTTGQDAAAAGVLDEEEPLDELDELCDVPLLDDSLVLDPLVAGSLLPEPFLPESLLSESLLADSLATPPPLARLSVR